MSRKYVKNTADLNLSCDKDETLTSHLNELRYRVIYLVISVLFFSILSFSFSDYILSFCTNYLLKDKVVLHFFSITEPFTIRLKISFLLSIFINIPIIIFHIWKFIVPALKQNEKKIALPSIFFATILFYIGALLSFIFIIPQCITMLLQFTPSNTANSISANSFVSFISCFTFFAGIICELPIASFIATKIGLINYKLLVSKRKYSTVIIWILAAILTPPDVFSQIIAATAMMALYEISVIVSYVSKK